MPEPLFSSQFVAQLSTIVGVKGAGEFIDHFEALRSEIAEQKEQLWRLNDQLGHTIGVVEQLAERVAVTAQDSTLPIVK